MGIIVFYEGENGTENIVQTVEDSPGQNFQPVHQDTIRSCKLFGVRPGCELTLFDSPDGSTSENFCIVNIKRVTPEYVVPNFVRSYEDEYVAVYFINNESVDKNIGRIKIN